MPTHRESQRPAADDSVAADDDVIAPATRDIYRRDWAEFAAWCRSNGADPAALPVSPALVADYLATLASSHGASAVRRRVASRRLPTIIVVAALVSLPRTRPSARLCTACRAGTANQCGRRR
jgi:hypothetical protein